MSLGLDAAEKDALLNHGCSDPGEEATPEPPANPVSQAGDLWLLGLHRLLGGVRPHLKVRNPHCGVKHDPR